MDISLVAKLKKYDEFISCYNEGDEKKLYNGKSLLFYSLSNNDTESRYLITDFLLNKGAEANVTNECGENLGVFVIVVKSLEFHLFIVIVTSGQKSGDFLQFRLIEGKIQFRFVRIRFDECAK